MEEGGGAQTIKLSVQDTGIGISPEDQQRIFEPFTRSNDPAVQEIGGTGLGLCICQKLALAMGSTLELKSAKDVGTLISLTMTLPIAEQEPAPANVITLAPARGVDIARGRHILVVDDHSINRTVLQRHIERLGYAVTTANNGLQALEAWQRGRFDCVITDCSMPGMGGYDLAREIRRAEAAAGMARMPIIACTANASRDAMRECKDAGMDAYLLKPFDSNRLDELLQQHLPSRQTDGPADSASTPLLPAGIALPEPGLLDLQRVRQIAGGDTMLERAVMRDLRKTNDEDVARLTDAVAVQDLETVRNVCHRLNGANQLLGATLLAAACDAMLQAAKHGDMEALDANFITVHRQHARMLAYLDAWLLRTPAGPAGGLRVLVVDDHPIQRQSMRMMLEQLGADHVAEAEDGQYALQQIAGNPSGFDVVLTDLSMPNLDGMALIDRLDATPGLSLIVVSADDEALLASSEQIMQRSTAHFLGMLEKPVTMPALSALLTQRTPEQAEAA